MADTLFSSANNNTLKLWAKAAFKDSVKETIFGKLMGTSDRSIVQVKDELSKSAGDLVRFRLRALPNGIGVEGDETLEGREEGLTFHNFDLKIDEKRHATKVTLGINQQRVNFDLRTEAKDALVEWFSEYMDTTFIEFLSGSTSLTYHTSAPNTSNAPSTNRIVYGGNATAKGDVDADDKMSLTVIDRLVEKAKLASPTMRKASFDGKNAFVLLLHPYQVYDLRTNTNAGQWLDIQKAAMSGGDVTKNPIFTEALGVYNGVILVESTRVKTFSDYGAGSVKAARALFMGAQAAVCAFGRGFSGDEKMNWTEKTFDYGKRLGVAGTVVWGIQKSRFNNEDFGVVAVDTAAAPH